MEAYCCWYILTNTQKVVCFYQHCLKIPGVFITIPNVLDSLCWIVCAATPFGWCTIIMWLVIIVNAE
jgi:hypothetical protein